MVKVSPLPSSSSRLVSVYFHRRAAAITHTTKKKKTELLASFFLFYQELCVGYFEALNIVFIFRGSARGRAGTNTALTSHREE